MPRRAKADEDKRQLIGARFNPEVRRMLEQSATANKRSLGAEVEARVAALAMCDQQTLDLFSEIAREIEVIQRMGVSADMKPRCWHKHLPTYAAVAEMLRHGPLRRHRPDDPFVVDDEVVRLSASLRTYHQQKEEIARQLAAIGVAVLPDRPKRPVRFGGLFGAPLIGAGAAFDHRNTERAAINAIPDDDLQRQARELFEQIVKLDEEEAQADSELGAALKPYFDAEREGAERYRAFRQGRAIAAFKSGAPFSWSDIF